MVITLSGGSLIDATKASIVITALGGNCEDYYGTNLVSNALTLSGKKLLPHLAIMTSSTNCPHLNSFSLVDVADHGKSVALLQPYWGAFFTPAIPLKIQKVSAIYQKTGFLPKTVHLDAMSSPELGKTYAAALHTEYRQVGFPCSLQEITGFSPVHIERMITAAKNPQLAAKL